MSARSARRWLRHVWSKQPGKGSVFLAVKDWDTGGWEDHCFDSLEDVRLPSTRDLYFAPNTYDSSHRRKVAALPGRFLYADLDEVDPRELDLLPTIAWETSPGRFQALWLLARPLSPANLAKLNQKLTYYTGADKGGWSLTKVLRVPGSVSTKHDANFPVTELWNDGPVHQAAELYRAVKSTRTPAEDLKDLPSLVLPKASFEALRKRHWRNLPLEARKALRGPVERGRRSEVLWKLERQLLEAKVPPPAVFVLAKGSAANKYKGQAREDRQLWTEIQRAVQTPKPNADDSSGIESTPEKTSPETETNERKWKLLPREEYLNREIAKAPWLVRDVWDGGAVGVLAGPSKTFKSFLALDLAISVASGEPFLEHFPIVSPGPVIVIPREDQEAVTLERAWAIEASKGLVPSSLQALRIQEEALDLREIPYYIMNQDGLAGFKLTDSDALEWLLERILEIQPRLITLDSFYLLASDIDENVANEVTPVLENLLDLGRQTNTSIVLVHHYKKPSDDNPGPEYHRISGSGVFGRVFESGVFVDKPDEKAYPKQIRFRSEHRSQGPQGPFYVSFNIHRKEVRRLVKGKMILVPEASDLEYEVTVSEHPDEPPDIPDEPNSPVVLPRIKQTVDLEVQKRMIALLQEYRHRSVKQLKNHLTITEEEALALLYSHSAVEVYKAKNSYRGRMKNPALRGKVDRRQ